MAFAYEERQVIESLSFGIEPGEKVALLGCNGSGKSTLLRLLAGLYLPKGGRYFFQNKKMDKKRIDASIRSQIGILFQNPESMLFNPTVFDEIAFSLREFGYDDIERRVEEIAEQFGLEELLGLNPLKLSGGEKQKVMLAAILVYGPDLLLLDEPTAAMDPATTGWFIDQLLEWQTTLVLATHDLSVAYETCERALVLAPGGQLLYDGPMEPLLKDYDLLVKANLIHKHRHRHKRFIHSHYHLHEG
ncbi:energy-coupling factor ABC transporter ATP-binding protein [Nitratifractor salsuginis]|uniref:ABC transporter related protein n=1 Tax=Nitratifractor salsuginis (strain DSM 16511 / JCM 12458 / E9I37-1) TaxID=749222 RepID=E6WYA9_NITSE|nr:ABC transporter ATP-binding protein [Nitratifractor salsuginis]ADV45357.1 ABC transporter related protein [Nitratifractor salsuginis DSM 16511]